MHHSNECVNKMISNDHIINIYQDTQIKQIANEFMKNLDTKCYKNKCECKCHLTDNAYKPTIETIILSLGKNIQIATIMFEILRNDDIICVGFRFSDYSLPYPYTHKENCEKYDLYTVQVWNCKTESNKNHDNGKILNIAGYREERYLSYFCNDSEIIKDFLFDLKSSKLVNEGIDLWNITKSIQDNIDFGRKFIDLNQIKHLTFISFNICSELCNNILKIWFCYCPQMNKNFQQKLKDKHKKCNNTSYSTFEDINTEKNYVYDTTPIVEDVD